MRDKSKAGIHGENLLIQNSNLLHWRFAIIGIVISILLIIAWIFIDLFYPQIKWASILSVFCQTTGTSILASVVFYYLFSVSTESRIIKNLSAEASKQAVDYAMQQVSQKFNNVMPLKIYPKTSTPLEEFNRDFDSYAKTSKIYYFMGDSATYTAKRLKRYRTEKNLVGKKIELLLLDPTETEIIKTRMRNDYPDCDKQELGKRVEQFQLSVFVTLRCLFELNEPVTVGFHHERLVFRYEIFDEAMFLTYRLGGVMLHTHLYLRESTLYQSFHLHFLQCSESCVKTKRINFIPDLKQNDFADILKRLGCSYSIEELDEKKRERENKNTINSIL